MVDNFDLAFCLAQHKSCRQFTGLQTKFELGRQKKPQNLNSRCSMQFSMLVATSWTASLSSKMKRPRKRKLRKNQINAFHFQSLGLSAIFYNSNVWDYLQPFPITKFGLKCNPSYFQCIGLSETLSDSQGLWLYQSLSNSEACGYLEPFSIPKNGATCNPLQFQSLGLSET